MQSPALFIDCYRVMCRGIEFVVYKHLEEVDSLSLQSSVRKKEVSVALTSLNNSNASGKHVGLQFELIICSCYRISSHFGL